MLTHIKLLWRDFAEFFRHDFHIAAYSYTIAATGLSILIAYGAGIGEAISYNRFPTSSALINNMLMFTVVYLIIAVPVLVIRGEFRTIPKTAFFAKVIFLMCLIGFADAFSWDGVLDLNEFSLMEQSYIFAALWRMSNILLVLPVLALLRLTVDRDVNGLYGLGKGNQLIKAYLYLFAVILPILAVVSFTPDFMSYYPMYKPWLFEGVFGRPVWLNTIIFEAVYISDFLMVEMIFRGVLVIGMASLLGRRAVLPMCMAYVALHFGKPALETISALFGGYFLGALAYQTRHIWGGVIIHMGIAFIIELLRFYQYYVYFH